MPVTRDLFFHCRHAMTGGGNDRSDQNAAAPAIIALPYTRQRLRQKTKHGHGVAGVNNKGLERICAYTTMPLMHLSRQTFLLFAGNIVLFCKSPCWVERREFAFRGPTHLEGLCMHLQRPSRPPTTHDTYRYRNPHSRVSNLEPVASAEREASGRIPVAFSFGPKIQRASARPARPGDKSVGRSDWGQATLRDRVMSMPCHAMRRLTIKARCRCC